MSDRRRRPLPNAVNSQDGRRVEGGRVERAGRMGKVVLGKIHSMSGGAELGKMIAKKLFHKQLLSNPHGHGRTKTRKATRCERVVCFKKPLKLQERLVVKRNRREVFVIEASLFQNVATRVDRKRRVVFLSAESFFLGRRDNLPIHQKCRRAIVVVR